MRRLLHFIKFMFTVSILLAACSPSNDIPPNEGVESVEKNNSIANEESIELGEESASTSTQALTKITQDYGKNEVVDKDYSYLEIITLLPPDAIPAIDDPKFLSAKEADEEYAPDELILGVEYNGDARAYSISHLSRHEIVNDTVGGVKISVTW
jgi:hypothetical protein